jgi:hypothetical protein
MSGGGGRHCTAENENIATMQNLCFVPCLIAITDEPLKIKIRNFKRNLLLNITNCQHGDGIILGVLGLPEN